MKKLNIEPGLPVLLSGKDELEITGYINETVDADELKLLAFNICRDHVHLLLVCIEEERDKIVNKLKATCSRKFNIAHGLTKIEEQGGMPPCSRKRRGKSQNTLWAQKYNWSYVLDERDLQSKYTYVKHNRIKHNLPKSLELEEIIESMLTSYNGSME
ncbi:MAG: transposase [Ignavibacteria bacterium]|nr:transposase [Ignavibacteria bacterium]